MITIEYCAGFILEDVCLAVWDFVRRVLYQKGDTEPYQEYIMLQVTKGLAVLNWNTTWILLHHTCRPVRPMTTERNLYRSESQFQNHGTILACQQALRNSTPDWSSLQTVEVYGVELYNNSN